VKRTKTLKIIIRTSEKNINSKELSLELTNPIHFVLFDKGVKRAISQSDKFLYVFNK